MQEPQLISVIDDDASVCHATGSLLRSLGYEVEAFHSAEDFLRGRPLRETACIICDVQMPGMSGIDLYEKLALQGSRTPIIFITAFSQERIRRRAGNDAAILRKPFEAADLVDCLQKMVVAPPSPDI
ncbi:MULTISPECIES: response regulator [Rhodomicrobium]|uniref:response regulator transcription factor n=1 Tax=Rhodomicrobium TaxID=1068 RepID=UPI000B4B10DA|nr:MULTISPECIES: response regulator [Rhodomicrobium]